MPTGSHKAGTEPLGMLAQRNGHLPVGPGPASPGWGQSQRWHQEGASPSISSTSGFSMRSRNCRAYAESDSTYRRCPSA